MGGAPSREATVVYSYLRGTYEIGLIPLTSAFFGRPSGRGEHEGENVLRGHFLQMREDLFAACTLPTRNKVLSWTEIVPNRFTGEDLDAFLEIVDKRLYPTNAAMVADKNSPLLPVPCAVCLVCKDGRERRGSFRWRGRNIVIIGYFGCMDEELDAAFKTEKRTPRQGMYSITAAVFPSIGDRTFDRVLALAPVMLRGQFVGSVLQLRRGGGEFATPLSERGEMVDVSSEAPSLGAGIGGVVGQSDGLIHEDSAVDSALEMFMERVSQMSVFVEVVSDNYSSLKSLVENVAFIQIHTSAEPKQCTLDLPPIVQNAFNRTTTASSCEKKADAEGHHAEKSPPQRSSAMEQGSSCCTVQGVSCSLERDDLTDLSSVEPEGSSHLSKVPTEDGGSFHFCTEIVRVHFSKTYVALAIQWLSSFFRKPSLLENGYWVHYCLKKEEEVTRRILCHRDTIVSGWRTSHPELANQYMGDGTDKLLEHVRILQHELQQARKAAEEPTLRKKASTPPTLPCPNTTSMAVLAPPPPPHVMPYAVPPLPSPVYFVQQQPVGNPMFVSLLPFQQVQQVPQVQQIPQFQQVPQIQPLQQISHVQQIPQLQQTQPVQPIHQVQQISHVQPMPLYHLQTPELQQPSVCYLPFGDGGALPPSYVIPSSLS
ncbi:hypothetical protein, conserved [Trypanosoma brucei gambiense DAL972]|uniref:Uncharacterized protein n=1 Tax=Trypanosoma brucei gambiense (strain MHOM/CI/86/DAL972) TaxID=679716 RepID=C9ZI93_TRYB9|nr:hypothetical protein, conserved [Trypanosoma brucei gambiense DAL972]CBH08885.1 hypothetical protein, conserved [Trypanosoma brucei gambiense DAL972]|eukprot:XP_011771326.1 hypothetical protein, conserved [Trypanosoma brucei gambiense DAL972]